MRSEIEWARARQARTGELATAARYAREQLTAYRARSNGPRVSSPARLRELEQASDLAKLRLQLAQTPPDPVAAEAGPGAEAGFRGETDDGIQFE